MTLFFPRPRLTLPARFCPIDSPCGLRWYYAIIGRQEMMDLRRDKISKYQTSASSFATSMEAYNICESAETTCEDGCWWLNNQFSVYTIFSGLPDFPFSYQRHHLLISDTNEWTLEHWPFRLEKLSCFENIWPGIWIFKGFLIN